MSAAGGRGEEETRIQQERTGGTLQTHTHTHRLKSRCVFTLQNDFTTETSHKEIHTFKGKYDLLNVVQQLQL